MAIDKAVDSSQLDAGLTSIADSIRAKGGTSDALTFPDGFAAAIAAISAGDSSGIGVESGVYIPAEDTRNPIIEVSQEAHDGCLLILLAADEDDYAAITATQSLYAMGQICIPQFYVGDYNGYHMYVTLRNTTGNTNGLNAATSTGTYSGGPSVEGNTIRLTAGHAYTWLRSGVRYYWDVYYIKEEAQ